MEDLKTRFLNIYANLPLGLRKEIIVVLDNEPITWNVAFVEVSNNTPKGLQILKNLEGLKII
ncbi:MAG TPA: hypothetical protein VJA40_02065 [archaeon]|nr:hypothetical protein [archaeon]